jgi:hypothetical protein
LAIPFSLFLGQHIHIEPLLLVLLLPQSRRKESSSIYLFLGGSFPKLHLDGKAFVCSLFLPPRAPLCLLTFFAKSRKYLDNNFLNI